jgi:hypothetical protein
MNKKLVILIAIISITASISESAAIAKSAEVSRKKMGLQSSTDFVISQVDSSTPTSVDIVNPKLNNKPISWSVLDFSSPNSPAAKLIGNDKTIQAISTPKDLSVGVLNGVNSDGDFATGFSIETLPYVLVRGKGLTLSEYRDSSLTRFLSNAKLSVATTKATGNNEAARLGVGVEFVLINNGDLRNDQCLLRDIEYLTGVKPEACTKNIALVPEKLTPCELDPDKCKQIYEKYLQKLDPQFLVAKKAAEERGEKASMWTVAAGSSWVSPTGSYRDLRGEGIGVWTTYKQGIGTNSQLLFQGSYRTNERTKVKGDNNDFVDVDTLMGGVRFLSGDRNFRFSLETAYNRESQGGQQNNDYLSYGIGIEPRVGEDLWLSLSFGGTTGRQNGSDVQIGAGLKWNFNTGYQTLEELRLAKP